MGTLEDLRRQDSNWNDRQHELEVEEWESRMEKGVKMLHPYEAEDEEHHQEMQDIRMGIDMPKDIDNQ